MTDRRFVQSNLDTGYSRHGQRSRGSAASRCGCSTGFSSIMEVWLANAAYGDHLGHMGLVLTIITCLMGSSGTQSKLWGEGDWHGRTGG